MQIGVRVQGLNQTVRDLEQMGVDVEDMKDAMARIAERGRVIASVAAPRRSGKLAADIRGNRAKAKAVVTAGRADRKGKDGKSRRNGVPYAGPINYGWPRRNIAAAGFMQKASDDLVPIAPRILQAEIDRLIKRRRLG